MIWKTVYHPRAVWMHRRAIWFPIQFCMICGRPFWAGLPVPKWMPFRWTLFRMDEWMPGWNDYCSKKCCDEDEP